VIHCSQLVISNWYIKYLYIYNWIYKHNTIWFPKIGLSRKICTTYTNFVFINIVLTIINYRRSKEVLIFIFRFYGKKIKKNTFWAMYGTFAIVTTPFMQLYTISYIKEHNIFPCARYSQEKKGTYVFNLITQISYWTTKPVRYYRLLDRCNLKMLPRFKDLRLYIRSRSSIIRKGKEKDFFLLYNSFNNIKRITKALMAFSFVKIRKFINQSIY
jgi:hypothetical protein